jgi:hypothetical protein
MKIGRVAKVISAVVIGCVAVIVALVCYLRVNGYLYDTVTIRGKITPQTFLQVRKWLKNSTQPNKTVVIDSGGGDAMAAIAIGKLIHQHGWNVRVDNHCYSSCADYIFPAGKIKFLTKSAMLIFHGDPHQENFAKQVENYGLQVNGQKTASSTTVGVGNKEFVITPMTGDGKGRSELQTYLSIPETFHHAAEFVNFMISLSDGFYKELGVYPFIGSYGQTGRYKETYESYKYMGFTYSLESLNKLGLENIQLADGEWHPELNPDYKLTYEVTYP